jgi:phosphotriesterase-related protein
LNDLKLYKKFGGTTILENTTIGIGRDNQLIIRLSRESGVNVIAGTGKKKNLF